MKTTLLAFLSMVLAASADTYYVRYFQDTGAKTAYDTDFPITSYTMGPDGTYFTGFPEPSRRQGVFSTTNDPATRTNLSQFADAIVLNPTDLSYSIRRTPEWFAFTNTLAAYSPAMDAVTNSISKVTDAKSKASDNDLKNAIKVLQDEIKALRVLLGKNMLVEP